MSLLKPFNLSEQEMTLLNDKNIILSFGWIDDTKWRSKQHVNIKDENLYVNTFDCTHVLFIEMNENNENNLFLKRLPQNHKNPNTLTLFEVIQNSF